MKAVLRGKKIIAMSSYKKKKKRILEELQNKLKELERKHKSNMTLNILEEVRKTRTEMDKITTQEARKKLMFLKQRYDKSRSKSMKILVWK